MYKTLSLVLLLPVLACTGTEDGKDSTGGGADLPDQSGDADGSADADDSGTATADDTDADADADGGLVDSGEASDDEIVLPAGLNGDEVEPRRPAPEFVATNRDGATRTREDLTYRPTVMWFYPYAGTPG